CVARHGIDLQLRRPTDLHHPAGCRLASPMEKEDTRAAAWNIIAEAAVRGSHPARARLSSMKSIIGLITSRASASCERNSLGGWLGVGTWSKRGIMLMSNSDQRTLCFSLESRACSFRRWRG